MILKHLAIEKFRNLARVDLDLAGGVTLLWGRNAQGKTNLLEAVHYLATGRSFRTRIDRECLPWGAESGTVARMEGRLERANAAHDLAVSLTDRAKFAWVDGKALSRLGELFGKIMVVLFTPGDISIAAGAPARRRRFLDMMMSQAIPAYLHALQAYTESLRQRNAALRAAENWGQFGNSNDSLDPWAGLLIRHGVEISLMRRRMVHQFSGVLSALYAEIAPGDPPLSIEYRSAAALGADDDRGRAAERFRARLIELAESERTRGQTLVGPHRDDVALKIGGREVRDFGSQGQQRSVALALRLAELKWMGEQTGEQPVLLVDDLGAELDQDRRARLLTLFASGAQTLATTAEGPEPLGRMMEADRAFEVRGGALLLD